MLKTWLLLALLQKGNNSNISVWSESDKLVLTWVFSGLLVLSVAALIAYVCYAYSHPSGGDISRS